MLRKLRRLINSLLRRQRILGLKRINEDNVYFIEENVILGWMERRIEDYLIVQNCGEVHLVYRVVQQFYLSKQENFYAHVKLYATVPSHDMAIWSETFLYHPYIGMPSRIQRMKAKNRELEDTLNDVLATTPWRSIGPEALDRAKKAVNFS